MYTGAFGLLLCGWRSDFHILTFHKFMKCIRLPENTWQKRSNFQIGFRLKLLRKRLASTKRALSLD
jgi:hypothetical protein